MIGSGLKKLAQENGMTVSNGVAYGALRGFAATLSEGAGFKQIVFSTSVTDPAKRMELSDTVSMIGDKKLYSMYRVRNLGIGPRTIQVIFHDNPGTMKKIRVFLDWFIPLLEQAGATPWNICCECGTEVTNGGWVMVNGVCYYLHESCAQKVERDIQADNDQKAEEDTGNYFTGLLGALLGAVLGAVVWAIVLNVGYVASIVGLLIGFLAEKGYNLLRGKQGKAKVAILIVAVIFGVLLGTFGADAMTLAGMIGGGELPGFGYGDIPMFILAMLTESGEYAGAVGRNILMGLLFAGLGAFALLRQTGKDVSGTKFKKL